MLPFVYMMHELDEGREKLEAGNTDPKTGEARARGGDSTGWRGCREAVVAAGGRVPATGPGP